MISQNEITFVIQGPIVSKNNTTKEVLRSIRQYYPGSSIILSTWKNSQITDLEYDLVILNEDPGAKWPYLSDRNVLNNNNRQIVSTINGLRAIKSKYAVKSRTDIKFFNDNIASYIDKRSGVGAEKVIFENRIISPLNLAINPRRIHKMPFHPSDFFFAGDTSDLITLFDIPLMTNEEMTWFSAHPVPLTATHPTLLSRFANEQYILLSCLKMVGMPIEIQHAFDNTEQIISLSERIIGDNFDLISTENIGINSLKYPLHSLSNKSHVYTKREFMAIKNGHPAYHVGIFDFERISSNLIEASKHVYRKLSDCLE